MLDCRVKFVGKELFIRGVSAEVKDKHLIKFFKKNGIVVESVELASGKSYEIIFTVTNNYLCAFSALMLLVGQQ